MAQVIDDRWQIQETLRQGGQAETFVVHDRRNPSGPPAVLKRLKNRNRLARFEQEVAAIQQLHHPNVLKLIDSNVQAERPYFVSEHCSKGSLEEQKAAILAMEVDGRLDLYAKICAGVAAAHAVPIVHRDLKPSNVFIRETDEPVVGDFGLCYMTPAERLTEAEEAVGARYYMAPELADGRSEQVTARSDVYSLGKMLYWLMTGSAFDREDHRRSDRLLPARFGGDESMLHVHQLLDRMIAYDSAARLPDAQALANPVTELRRLLDGGYATLEHPPTRCHYCGKGRYRLLGNSHDTSAVHYFGLQGVNTVPHIFVCQNCGHVQLFRPAYGENKEWLGS